ncbi:NAD(P)H-hydrate epimerase [Rhodovulum adriaticum]|uniref:NAD(P)H-hydrate epimerase n=1 Tax=Rhodovulum adriaticum TaxID=35804 RepID=A0A4R2NVA6_RHOAD|nr:NAD(P)H-hydrate epimerase [Rhodovulum adriaticum]TCP25498.1 hydroxyethylthiazole kinase-like uncharacterized protein yjeF [Rhodovulum adriaticum]
MNGADATEMVIPVTAAQMRAIEVAAIASGAVTGLILMERAGAGAARALAARWPRLRRAVVLCGPGNNGGDGFVIARWLALRGWCVTLFLYGDPAGLPPDARRQHDLWRAVGDVRPLQFPDATAADGAAVVEALQGAVCVDALFGTGLARPLAGLRPVLAAVRAAPRLAGRMAVDLPSGLSADDGDVVGGDPALVLPADLTVTFHARKRGHGAGQGTVMCGDVKVVDIGLRPWDGARGDGA